jgi:retron-type reverse transcriptase
LLGCVGIKMSEMFDKIIEFENLYNAYLKARKGNRYKKEVMLFFCNLEENLINIQNHLMWKSWQPKPFKEFYVYDPKKRLISAPTFEDRVVHHALCNVIEPLFEKRFIYDSYACRKGKGTHAAVDRAQMFLRRAFVAFGRKPLYVLKCDISKYFPNIDHKILINIISKTIKDENVLWLCNTIISANNNCGKGLPVGALTSQLFANVYLDIFDHFIKDKVGVKYYLRYMDDFLIIHRDKKFLHSLKSQIEHFLDAQLSLKLNPKTSIFPAKHYIDFCGYRIKYSHLKPRKRNVLKAKRRLKKYSELYSQNKASLSKIKSSISSFLGYLKKCNNIYASFLTTINFSK